MFATIVNLTNVFEIAITLFAIWHNTFLDFNSHQWYTFFDFNSHRWCVNLPWGARQPAPHMGQVDAVGTMSHNI